MIANRWLIPLDHSRIPNFARYAGPIARHPVFDPKNRYTVTWQAGITGIGYDPRMTGREITSVKDLWDPAFKGKVGMMSDDTELGSVGMLALGIDPAKSTPADWKRAADAPDQAARRGDRPPVLRPELHQGARGRRHLDHAGVVRRHLPGQLLRLPAPQVRDPEGGRDALARQLHDPAARRRTRSTRWSGSTSTTSRRSRR